jgi:hypothetical protein
MNYIVIQMKKRTFHKYKYKNYKNYKNYKIDNYINITCYSYNK